MRLEGVGRREGMRREGGVALAEWRVRDGWRGGGVEGGEGGEEVKGYATIRHYNPLRGQAK